MKRKQVSTVFLAALFLFSSHLLAGSGSALEKSLISFDKMISSIKVSSVIGKPVRSGDTIVIPFSRISFGLGGGGAMMGYGGGMGGKTVPLGYLVIKGDDVDVEIFPLEEKKPSFFQEMLPVLFKVLPQIMGKKFPFPAPAAPAPPSATKKIARPSSEMSLEEVKKLFYEKKFSEALETVDSLIASDPDNAEFHAWKGNIMGSMAQGNPVNMMKYGMGAMQEFERALQLDPENATAHFGRGIGRLMAPEGFGGDLDGAIEDFEFVCLKDPFPEAFYQLGVAYRKKGLLDKAADAFKKALELKPDYTEAAKALAEIK